MIGASQSNCFHLVPCVVRSAIACVIPPMPCLIPVFADQLSLSLSSLRGADLHTTVILMMEVADETDHVGHHRRKIAFLFAAMRHFAQSLEQAGFTVRYVRLDDPENTGSFDGEIARAVGQLSPDRITVCEPGEWRVEQMVRSWQDRHGLPVDILEDDRFVASRGEFAQWAQGRKQLRMEWFYRDMRRKTGLLVENDKPVGGQWNFDQENRKPASADLFMPKAPSCAPDEITQEVLAMVEDRFPGRFGDLDGFEMAVTRADALEAARIFMAERLPKFGDFQDAMLEGEDLLWHSLLSPALNAGLLDPLELCQMAVEEFASGRAPLNSVEGYVRQIIGWREYVRGIYWLSMPGYAQGNALQAYRQLPHFYWDAKTDMRCVAQVVDQTRRLAYAHHIQRLMVTGNFALLAGIHPHEVHEWYLAVYADAFEWVEMPNTIGMSQYADGGLMASKPYAASGNYINRMSDHCTRCRFRPDRRTGPDACPFNFLYWDFLARNRDRLAGNQRMKMMLKNLDRIDEGEMRQLRIQAAQFLDAVAPKRTD